MSDLYNGIDKDKQDNCKELFMNLVDEFNNGDVLIRNFIINNMFNFIMSVIIDDEIRQRILDAYMMLE